MSDYEKDLIDVKLGNRIQRVALIVRLYMEEKVMPYAKRELKGDVEMDAFLEVLPLIMEDIIKDHRPAVSHANIIEAMKVKQKLRDLDQIE